MAQQRELGPVNSIFRDLNREIEHSRVEAASSISRIISDAYKTLNPQPTFFLKRVTGAGRTFDETQGLLVTPGVSDDDYVGSVPGIALTEEGLRLFIGGIDHGVGSYEPHGMISYVSGDFYDSRRAADSQDWLDYGEMAFRAILEEQKRRSKASDPS